MLARSHRHSHSAEARVSHHVLDAAAVAQEHGHDLLGAALVGRADSIMSGEALYIEDTALANDVQDVVLAAWMREGYAAPPLR
jgi:hypothetical protein